MIVENKLKQMGITIPETPKPVAAYIPAIQMENWVFTSGQIPVVAGELKYVGKLGDELSIEDGYEAAKICAINALSAAKSVIGDLDRIEQIVKVVGFVNCVAGFADQPKVINGASELLKAIFGDKGAHARSAVGVAGLPLNSAVEVEIIFKIRGDE